MSELSMETNDNVTCFLVSDENPEIKFILLDSEPLILGRTKQTGIVDQRMSKNQMKFVADYSTARVLVEQLGSNKSAVNDESMIKGEKRLLIHGDKVALLFKSNYTYHLDFVTPPTYGVESKKKDTNCLDKEMSHKKSRSDSTPQWECKNSSIMVYNSSNIFHKDKIAAFDLDGTLIVTRSGKVFPVDENDWQIHNSEVVTSINKLSNDGYKIVIFTNQGGISKLKVNFVTFKIKIENICEVLKVPVQVFIATEKDINRKPAPGMWNILVSDYNGDVSVNIDKSFFCGDAAGRPARFTSDGKQIKKDHSCCDRLFAMNIGLKFYTPEEYFLKEPTDELYTLPEFNPNDIMANILFTDLTSKFLFSPNQEMIIMVGCPGSGKSYFASNNLLCHDRNMKIINRDTLGSWQKCVAEAKKYLSCNNYSVVIDNTNPDIDSRKRFIDLAKSLKIPCRAFLMNVSKDHGKHNNKFREFTDKKHPLVSDAAINFYFSKFQEPSKSEGIDEIVKINFVPHFKDPDHEKLYKMFLL
ncbi:LOW QUALITY PROTEIN: uncharacterized protein F21D5.5-like [Rhopalosiphum padi]|uniref:LOW QUALITY PROTEIN: uncharacterized protein F21D5.5-like n=1 Tax=Rhopalosiphum padi TaxID=40932 RepID=UPI00298E0EC7|nr:LOW QUALITY PROTEIN: uncharacterized protein F21D5.5-like [Rhopalosiphum padi]